MKKIILATLLSFMSIVIYVNSNEALAEEITDSNQVSFNTSVNDFLLSENSVNLSPDQIFNNKALSYPKSIDDYKRLGYKNINYTPWKYNTVNLDAGNRNTINLLTITLGFVPSAKVKATATLIGTIFNSGLGVQYGDVLLKTVSRRILATAPYGLEVLIGQEYSYEYIQNTETKTKGYVMDLLPI